MKKFDISRSLKTVKSVVTANSPVLLVGATITGIVATGVMAARAGYKARGIVDEAQLEKGSEPLTPKEKVELTWLCYAAPVLTGAGAIASCLGVHFIHTKRHAALAGLYALTAGKLDDYKDAVEDAMGVKKHQEFQERMAQKAADGSPLTTNNEVIMTEGGTDLFQDSLTGRWFMSSMSLVAQAVNEANSMLIDEGELDINSFYEYLGLPGVPLGRDLGWSRPDTKRIAVAYVPVSTKEGRPANSISFRNEPMPKLGRP